jgi:hypothetical protein
LWNFSKGPSWLSVSAAMDAKSSVVPVVDDAV